MALHAKDFREELYVEHLEEAAYLYETRCHWLIDADVSWLDLEENDTRIEAHLDALSYWAASRIKSMFRLLT